jgi:predicted HTH transcriptional regulator
MFNLINIGERSGSGVPNIFNTWEDEGWKEPVIEERFDPDRTVLTLEFVEKQAKKASDKKQATKTSEESKRRKQAKKTGEESKRKKTSDNIERICEYLAKHGESKTNDIADYINLSPSRTRAILSKMENVEIIGTNTNRKYKLKQ